MQRYRAYVTGLDDDIINVIDLYCENDDAAKTRVQQFFGGYEIELWQSERQIAGFEAKSKQGRLSTDETSLTYVRKAT